MTSTSEPVESPVPEGFTPFERGGPFFTQLGPAYTRPADDGGVVVALRVADKHTNGAGITHGGMLTALADSALGINIAIRRKRMSGQVTVSLSVDFLSPAQPGDWLEAFVHIRRVGLRLAFGDCILKVGTREVLRCSAVFSIATLAAKSG
jgi:uncharacterized protein (TIGR00369 family)